MELKHSFTVPVPLDRAWDVLLDVERVAPCMPGATLDSVDGDDIAGKIKVKVGPIAMTYTGKAKFTERNREAGVVTLEASGKETRGAGTAAASVRSELIAAGDQTQVTVLTNLSVTGKPAQFGRGVLNEVSGKLIGIFADNLAKMLAAEHGSTGVASSEVASTEAAASAGASAAAGEARPEASAAAAGEADGRGAVLAESIEVLNLPVRAYNSLRREGVHTVAALVARTPQQLLAIDNIGPASVDEIQHRLADHGLALSEAAAGDSADGDTATAGSGAGTAGAGASGEGAADTGLTAELLSDAATANGSGQPGTVFPDGQHDSAGQHDSEEPALRTVPPAPAWQPDDDAIDLLSVAGLPVLRRALPAVAGVAALAVVVLGIRRRRRRAGR